MEYKDYEIFARVHYTGNKLRYLNEDGSLGEVEFEMEHDDDTVVWYEVPELDHLSVKDGRETLYFIEIPDIDEAKRRIDLNIEQHHYEED